MNISRIILPAILALTTIAPTSAQAKKHDGKPCSKAHRAEIEEFADLYIEVYNSQDMSRLDEVLTPDSINHNPFGVMTVEQLAATMEDFFVAFPDLHYELEEVVVDGEYVVIEYTYTGTHLGPLLGLAPTGTVVHGRGLEIHTLDDGRITETRNYSDVFGLFAQLGLL